jgi:hypothetical protein
VIALYIRDHTKALIMIQILNRILDPLELIGLMVLTIALILRFFGISGGPELIMVSMSELGMVYFLNAYRPPVSNADTDDQPKGFFTLLATSIAKKVGFLACSVVIVGSLYRILHLKGADEMLRIGSSAVIGASVIMGVYLVMDRERASQVLPALYRTVPIGLIGAYLLLNNVG